MKSSTIKGTISQSFTLLTKREKTQYVLLVSARTVSNFLDLLGLLLIGLVASAAAYLASPPDSPSTPFSFLGLTFPKPDPSFLLVLVGVVLATFIGKSLLALIISRALAHLLARIETRQSSRIGEYILTGSLDESRQYSLGDFQVSMVGSLSAAFGGSLMALATIISEGFLLLLIIVAFFVVSPVIALATLAYFAVLGLAIQMLVSRTLKRAGVESNEGAVLMTNTIQESLSAYREISVLEKQDYFLKRMRNGRARFSHSMATISFVSSMPRYIVETALILGIVALVVQQYLTGNLANGLVVLGVFLAGGMRVMASLLPLQQSFISLRLYSEQTKIAHTFMTQSRVPPEPPTNHDQAPNNSINSVEIRDVTFSYPGAQNAGVRNIDLTIPSGSFVAFIGPSGAGKTTIVDLLLGLLTPQSGEISTAGMSPNDLRKTIPGYLSYVPQKPGIVGGSIAENIALGVEPENIDWNRLAKAISMAHLDEFIAQLPDGVHTSVGLQLDSLSGGQIQRIGLARALYVEPKILIMDEATSALDATSEAFISDTLAQLHGEVTVVVIAHRLSTVQHADEVFLIDKGELIGSGTLSELVETNATVAEFVRLMSFADARDN